MIFKFLKKNKIYNKNKFFHRNLLSMIVILSIFFSLFYLIKINYVEYIFTDYISDYTYGKEKLLFTDNYLRQTEALANGSFSLLVDTGGLQQLENPYSVDQRRTSRFLWDTSYYKGKYYSYYTILPIIFILLPIYKIFGFYLNLVVANLLILGLALFIISKLYQKIVENYFSNISLFVYALGFLTIIFGSNIFMLIRGLKYDIPVSCGILSLFSVLYIFYLVYLSKKNICLKVILAGVFTALLVCSKPSYIIYYPLIFYLGYKIKKKNNLSFKYVLLYFLPCVIIGLLQMWYNFMRYESVFEFGAKYQLTGFYVYDYMHFSLPRIFRGLKSYLFQLPSIDFSTFPYVFMKIASKCSNCSEFLYEWYLLGLCAFPVFIYSFLLMFIKKNDKFLKGCKKIMLMVYITFLLMVILNCCVAGVSETYSLDLKSLLMFVSVIFLLKNYMLYSNNDKKPRFKKIAIICIFLFNILLVFPISFSGENLLFLNGIKFFSKNFR